jgi:hypothetical protein
VKRGPAIHAATVAGMLRLSESTSHCKVTLPEISGRRDRF